MVPYFIYLPRSDIIYLQSFTFELSNQCFVGIQLSSTDLFLNIFYTQLAETMDVEFMDVNPEEREWTALPVFSPYCLQKYLLKTKNTMITATLVRENV